MAGVEEGGVSYFRSVMGELCAWWVGGVKGGVGDVGRQGAGGDRGVIGQRGRSGFATRVGFGQFLEFAGFRSDAGPAAVFAVHGWGSPCCAGASRREAVLDLTLRMSNMSEKTPGLIIFPLHQRVVSSLPGLLVSSLIEAMGDTYVQDPVSLNKM